MRIHRTKIMRNLSFKLRYAHLYDGLLVFTCAQQSFGRAVYGPGNITGGGTFLFSFLFYLFIHVHVI